MIVEGEKNSGWIYQEGRNRKVLVLFQFTKEKNEIRIDIGAV